MRHTILLADDSPTIQRLVTQTFDGEKFSVISVSNGEAAVGKFEEIRPAIVLADIFMPGRTGYELCSYIKAHPELAETPVVLLVGAFEAFDQKESDRVGANGLVKKPFEPQQLFEVVSNMIADASALAPGVEAGAVDADEDDLFGLAELFPAPEAGTGVRDLSDDEIEVIADRVMNRISTEIIEGIAWEVVPEVADRVLGKGRNHRNED